MLCRFLLCSYALGFATQFLAIKLGMEGKGVWLMVATMWTPTVAVLLLDRENRGALKGPLSRPGWKYFGVAVGAVLSINALNAAFLLSTGNAVFGPRVTDPKALFFFKTILHKTEPILSTTLLAAIGEELGWRAYLQPKLEKRFGILKGTVFVALIWAYWHLPINLCGYYNDPVHPMVTSFVLFPFGLIFVSFLLRWLTVESRSIWPAALAHGSVDALSSLIGQTGHIRPISWAAENFSLLASFTCVGGIFIYLSVRKKGSVSVFG